MIPGKENRIHNRFAFVCLCDGDEGRIIMSEELKKLIELVSVNEEAGRRFQELSDLDEEERNEKCVALAREYGLTLTTEDLKAAVPEKDKHAEVTLDELESIDGGTTCVCVVGGGGGSAPEPCACVVGGIGFSRDKERACFCLFGGGGKGDIT